MANSSTADTSRRDFPMVRWLVRKVVPLTPILVVTGFCLLFVSWGTTCGEQQPWAARGQIGDFLNGHLSAIFGFVTMVFVAGAFISQRDELASALAEAKKKEAREDEQLRLNQKQVRESFALQFLVRVAELERNLGAGTISGSWHAISSVYPHRKKDTAPPIDGMGPDVFRSGNKEVLKAYLQAIDFIGEWASDEEKARSEGWKYFKLIRAYLPPSFFKDIHEFKFFYDPEIAKLRGLRAICNWNAEANKSI